MYILEKMMYNLILYFYLKMEEQYVHDIGINIDQYNPKVLYIFNRQFSANEQYNRHSHDFFSLIYITSGGCNYNINDNIYPVKKGNIILLNPGMYHLRQFDDTSDEVSEFHIGLSDIRVYDLPFDHLIETDADPVTILMKHDSDFLKCLSEILVENQRNEPGSRLVLKACVMKLIVYILRETHLDNIQQTDKIIEFDLYDKMKIVSSIVNYINQNYWKSISLDSISQNMYLSPAYISKIFKEITGESPINYLIRTRLSKAAELLENPDLKIREISFKVGYTDVYHFSKLFKKYFNMPPTKYRLAKLTT